MNDQVGREATAWRLCPAAELAEGAAREFIRGAGLELRAVLVVRKGARVYGYENVCPHQHTPLNWMPDRFICGETGLLLCATHGARFRIEDGLCVSGPCKGKSLQALGVEVSADGYLTVPG